VRRLGRVAKWALAAAVFLAAAGIAFRLTLESDWMAEKIRVRIVEELERSTGGQAALGHFRFDWRQFEARADELRVRGLEGSGEEPLLSIGSVTVELKVASFLRKKADVQRVSLVDPRINLRRDADGKWNFPQPKVARQPGHSPFELFVDLAIGQLEIRNGRIQFDGRDIPLEFTTESFALELGYSRVKREYQGKLSSERLRMKDPLITPVEFDAVSEFRMDHGGLDFSQLRLNCNGSHVEASGKLVDWEAPKLEARATGTLQLADFAGPLRLPLERRGEASFVSTWRLGGDLQGEGTLSASGLEYRVAGITVAPISLDAEWSVRKSGAVIRTLAASVLEGAFGGKAEIADWKRFSLEGAVRDLQLARVHSLTEKKPLPWSGIVSGPVSVEGSFEQVGRVGGELTIEAGEDGIPVKGFLSAQYSVPDKILTIGPSHVELPRGRVHFQGLPSGRVEVGAFANGLTDILPVIEYFRPATVTELPAHLDQGTLQFTGVVEDMRKIEGRFEAGPVISDRLRIDAVRGQIAVTANQLSLRGVEARQGNTKVTGSVGAVLSEWGLTDGSALSGEIKLTNGRIENLLRDAGLAQDVKGAVSADVRISGTWAEPAVSLQMEGSGVEAGGELLDRVSASVRAGRNRVAVVAAKLERGTARIELSGDYSVPLGRWNEGAFRLKTQTNTMTLRQWKFANGLPEGLDALVEVQVSAAGTMSRGEPEFSQLSVSALLPVISLKGRPLGDARIVSGTKNRVMSAEVVARILGSSVRGQAEWSLTRNSYGLGRLRFQNLSLDNLRNTGLIGEPNRPLPARGSLDMEVGFSGPVLKPESWTGSAKISRLSIEPNLTAELNSEAARFALRNAEPITGTMDRRGFNIQSARLKGEGTDLEIRGSVAYLSRNPWNVQLRGAFSLAGLSVIERDLMASGVSTVDASVRGSFSQPQITGEMRLSNASFNLRGVTNGLDKVSGTIRFDRNRATLEKITAETGGGQLSVSGFVGFGGPQLLYRLQAYAKRVRVRYPASVSTTFDSDLTLAGTASQSVLSGSVLVTRVGLNPQTDFGGLLAEGAIAARRAPTSSQFLRGMRLDVRVQTSPGAELQTSLTEDISPEADLRLRGTAARPIALGQISLSEGEIDFFGNRYSIHRGDIGFYNTTKIEPVVTFDLETRVRGIDVTISVSGPPDKLQLSYRSDPPMQSAEIVALLTVGREPTAMGTRPALSSSQNQQSNVSGSLLGAAISAPLSNRMNRFFGVSRIKIDPAMSSLDNSPQARLTVEQQLSREITITYSTNLNRNTDQIIRVQWDFSRDYSLLASRDENGLYGVDFLYRRRFR
jgi:translocation and assembly module TamB